MSFITHCPPIIKVAILISLFGLIATFIVLIIIYLKRVRLIIDQKKEKKALKTILNELSTNVLIYNTMEEIPKGELTHTIHNLSKLQKASFTFKKMLMSTLLHFSVNLSDTSTHLVHSTYQLLGLRTFSLKKLRSVHWFVKIEGINEIEKMNDISSIPILAKLTSNLNLDVRVRAYAALIKLNASDAFGLLAKEKSQLSEWHQIFLLDAMDVLSISTMPEFRSYLTAAQKSIILLGIKAIIHFKQFSSISQMIVLLAHEDEQVRNQLIRALGLLNASTAEPKLKAIYAKESDKNKIQILLALGDIGSGESLDFIVEEFLNTNNHELRKAAMYSLNCHSEELSSMSTPNLFNLNDDQQMVVKHFQQPLNLHGIY